MAKASKVGGRGTTPVDAHIGQKIRARRNLLGLSQTELADAAGITFQQIQKYEKGVNRVGASRLQQFSDARLAFHHLIFLKAHPRSGKSYLRRRKASYPKKQSFHFWEPAKASLSSGRSWRSNKSQFAKPLLSFLRL
jgi:transcriptional regulator with XRE-family HTH domain